MNSYEKHIGKIRSMETHTGPSAMDWFKSLILVRIWLMIVASIPQVGGYKINSRYLLEIFTGYQSYRNKEHLRTAIYFRCGNLQLRPCTRMKVL